jgi:hypothetical protein
MSADAGFTWRQGAPADEIPVNAEIAYGLPWKATDLYIKTGINWVQTLGNKSKSTSIDRFNFPPTSTYNFNEASMLRLGASLIWIAPGGRWSAEAGYGQWIWGRGARQYKEPFFAVGRAF